MNMSSQKFIKSYKKIHQIIEFFFHSSSESSLLEGRVKYFGVFVGELSEGRGRLGVFFGECIIGDTNMDFLGTTKVDDGVGDVVESDIGDLNIDILGFLGAFSSVIGGGIIGAVIFLDGPANR